MLKVLAIVMLAAHVLVIPANSIDSETTQVCIAPHDFKIPDDEID